MKFSLLICCFLSTGLEAQTPFSSLGFGSEPILMAPGVVCSAEPEFAGSFSRDGANFWFNRCNADRSRIWLMETQWEKSGWSAARVAVFSDSSFRDVDPWVAADGVLYFSSTRPLPGSNSTHFNIWRLHPATAAPEPLGEAVNTEADEIYCSLSANGNIYFARSVKGESRIYRSKWENGRFQPAERLPLPIPDSISISNPAISADEQFLVFASGDMGGLGRADLFFCRRSVAGTWSPAYNLGPGINSTEADFAPSFSPDGKALIFSSERPGIVTEFPEGKRRPGDVYSIGWTPEKVDEFAVRSVLERYRNAWLKGDESGVLDVFEVGARISPNGQTGIDSLENIRDFWFPKDGSQTSIHEFDMETPLVRTEGDMAYSFQRTRLYWSYQKGKSRLAKIQQGIAHTVMRRQKDGGWKIWRQSWTDLSSQDAPIPKN